jgi:uncharacterized protein (TIGR02271 family)
MVDDDAVEAIPLLDEELRVEKQSVATGKVRVRTLVENVEEIARAELTEERVEVTRVPVGREVRTAPAVRDEGGVLIVPVMEEVLVVEKRLILKEELHIRRHAAKQDVEVPVTLRKQRAVIERVVNEGHTYAEE